MRFSFLVNNLIRKRSQMKMWTLINQVTGIESIRDQNRFRYLNTDDVNLQIIDMCLFYVNKSDIFIFLMDSNNRSVVGGVGWHSEAGSD